MHLIIVIYCSEIFKILSTMNNRLPLFLGKVEPYGFEHNITSNYNEITRIFGEKKFSLFSVT
jgi:hypothetical protein